MYRTKPKPIADLVSEYVAQYSDQQAIQRGTVLHRWKDVVGDLIADQCKDLYFDRRNRLIVSVPHASWRHEIHMQRIRIMELLNREAGAPLITEIVVRS